MILSRMVLENYRNFVHTEINFNQKTLVIGANDVGKTNLVHALRLLLDKNISENDLEPSDSDYCVINNSKYFKILLEFQNIVEDCIKSRMKENVSEVGKMYLSYEATKNSGGLNEYVIKAGPSLNLMDELPGRTYIRVLNIKYAGANRNVDNYVLHQKKRLIDTVKDDTAKEAMESDNKITAKVGEKLKEIEDNLKSISYLKTAGERLNSELKELSIHHHFNDIEFGIDIPSTEDLSNKIQLVMKHEDKTMLIGGDGLRNQLFISLWSAINTYEKESDEPLEVSIFIVEEPEAHLHPHQQRKLSEFLLKKLDAQVILTSHSPQIASVFNPDSIVRLYRSEGTMAAKKGVSKEIRDSINKLEFRLDIIPAEAYYSDAVLLVEGWSELVFYKALAQQIGIDLDKLNISILMVGGVGFQRFIELFEVLEIPWVMRTDNDVFQAVNNKKEYWFAGIKRCTDVIDNVIKIQANHPKTEYIEYQSFFKNNMHNLYGHKVNTAARKKKTKKIFSPQLERVNIYLADNDLEYDLFFSTIDVQKQIKAFLGNNLGSDEKYIKKMQSKKATFMYYFIESSKSILATLKLHSISEPLKRCKKIIEDDLTGV